jgi:hypothetical protein
MREWLWARFSVVVEAPYYKPEGCGVETRYGEFILFSIYLILPAALGPGVYLVSNRNEYQKQKKMFLVSRARPAGKANNLTGICEPIA